ncbi:ribonuclease III [Vandammella animalimorsus]|uniref:Ribonuclease 3 n=1 Tax=Vandammella animalimorsus TaxID=2029117 RepID=A0A3M6RJ48_9BURK|nr:ribonuclease III [Vandammella animalimorsus]
MSDTGLERLARSLGWDGAERALLQQALTHRSFSADHNERLEFLGDAVLNLCVSRWLMQRLPQASEGELSRTRANLVREQSLHRIALDLGLPELLRLGEGEKKSGGQQRPSMLADALEAVLGAVFLHMGFAAVEQLVQRLFAQVDLSTSAQTHAKDPKTRLQELLQGRYLALPHYELQQVRGADHQQLFVVQCTLQTPPLQAQGQGPSRKAAEQQAAEQLLEQLQQHGQWQAKAKPRRAAAAAPVRTGRAPTAPLQGKGKKRPGATGKGWVA